MADSKKTTKAKAEKEATKFHESVGRLTEAEKVKETARGTGAALKKKKP